MGGTVGNASATATGMTTAGGGGASATMGGPTTTSVAKAGAGQTSIRMGDRAVWIGLGVVVLGAGWAAL